MRVAYASCFLVSAWLGYGCGGDADPSGESGGSANGGWTATGGAANGGSASSSGGSTSGGSGGVECLLLTLPETGQLEQFQVVDAVPTGIGGTLKDGDYQLSAHIRYRAMQSGETASFMRAALRLRNQATVMDYIFDEGDPAETPSPSAFTAAVTPDGEALQLLMLCPARKGSLLGYTASGDTLSLFEENEEMRFQRK